MYEKFSSKFYVLSMMYETLKRMKDLLIVGEIYTNIRQNRAKKTVTVQKPKLLPRS